MKSIEDVLFEIDEQIYTAESFLKVNEDHPTAAIALRALIAAFRELKEFILL
jgi:hypothetical protein